MKFAMECKMDEYDSRCIIDLVSTAFEKIANLRTGLIHVRIERIDSDV